MGLMRPTRHGLNSALTTTPSLTLVQHLRTGRRPNSNTPNMSNTPNTTSAQTSLTIVQINLNHCTHAVDQLSVIAKQRKWDILLIQEPKTSRTGVTGFPPDFTVCAVDGDALEWPRAAIVV